MTEVAAEAPGALREGRRWNWPAVEKLYERSRKSLEKWITAGAPLTEPERMAQWWRENRKHRVPELLLDLEGKPEGVQEEEERMDLADVVGAGPQEALEQSRVMTAAAYRRLQEAMSRGDTRAVAKWRGEWKEFQRDQRHWEQVVTKVQREQGEALLISEVRGEATARLMTVRRRFEEELRKHVTKEEARERLAWIFAGLQECEFLAA